MLLTEFKGNSIDLNITRYKKKKENPVDIGDFDSWKDHVLSVDLDEVSECFFMASHDLNSNHGEMFLKKRFEDQTWALLNDGFDIFDAIFHEDKGYMSISTCSLGLPVSVVLFKSESPVTIDEYIANALLQASSQKGVHSKQTITFEYEGPLHKSDDDFRTANVTQRETRVLRDAVDSIVDCGSYRQINFVKTSDGGNVQPQYSFSTKKNLEQRLSL